MSSRSPVPAWSATACVRGLRTLLAVILAISATRRIASAEPAGTPVGDTSVLRGLRDRAELEAFLDGVMAAGLRDHHIAGATVVVVKDGVIHVAKGYGYADVARRTPVDPQRTLFHIGSVTKLFTWTAVMQLVEQARLDLDTDVNRYLDFEIPATYPAPITLRHILTHTTGFEDDARDLVAADPEHVIPLGRWLEAHIPARVRPPGQYAAYSNYAAALAGYIVQRVSGTPWDRYVEQHILAPLDMQRTTARQPVPAALADSPSGGYRYADGQFVREPWEVFQPTPAGAIAATATDMASFMLAHLGQGSWNGHTILRASTAAQMHARAFTHDPRLPGLALGFYERTSHGLRIIGHGGNTQWFHTDLALIPSENVGVFVSYNTDTGHTPSVGPFLQQFLDHYYPVRPEPVAPSAEAAAQATAVAGPYRFVRMSYTTYQRALGLTGASVTIRSNGDGSLRMTSASGEARFVPAGPMLYREELGTELIAFANDDAGRVTHLFLGNNPTSALERIPWYQRPGLHWVVLGIAVVVFAATIGAAITRWIRRARGTPRPEDRLPGRPQLLGLAAVNLSFVVALARVLGDPGAVIAQPVTALAIALSLPVIGAVLGLAAVLAAVRQWRARAGTLGARLRYDAVVIVALLFLWSLDQWNLLGWR